MTANTEPQIERALGPAEEIFWRLDGSSPMNTAATISITGPVTEEKLRVAVDAVQKRHPKLRVKMQNRGKSKPWMVSGVGQLPISTIDADVDIIKYVQQQLLVPFDSENGPLVRFGLQKKSDNESIVVFELHHSICDGKSAVLASRDLLNALQQVEETGVAELEALPQVNYYRERFPKSTKGFRGLLGYLMTIYRLLVSVLPLGKPQFLHVNENVPVENRDLVILSKQFESSLMKNLVAKCKEEDTTVHGAMYAAIVLASAKDIGNGESVCVGCASSIDLRDRLTPPVGDDVGYFVSAVGSGHKVSSKDPLWPLARDIRDGAMKARNEKMDMLLMPYPYNLHARVGRHMQQEKYAKYLEGAHNPPCIVVTNAGNIDIPVNYGPFTINDIGMFANPSVLTPFGSIISTLNGLMRWTLIGSSPVVTEQQLEQVFADAQNYLVEAIDMKEPLRTDVGAVQ